MRRLLATAALWCCLGDIGWAQLTNGLIGHWTFDEGSGTAVGDSSGQGNNGTLLNGVTGTWTTGNFGGALYFSGAAGSSATRVDIPDTTALQNAFTTAITFAAWVRVDDIHLDAPILDREGNGGLYSFWFGAFGITAESGASPGNFGVLLSSNGTSWTLNDRHQGSITPATWVHLAATWDGSQVVSYLNGTPVGSPVSYSSSLNASTGSISLGSNFPFSTTAFLGAVDDLYLYNRALTSSEIGQVMNGAAIPEPSTCAALAGLAALGLALRRRGRCAGKRFLR